ncbi:hypothetical protein C8R42DRAFT_664240 [Lentinula raphanica]|nr:hypothetical protein C8R42DRAFT_664240 [Lentinula raphanica]
MISSILSLLAPLSGSQFHSARNTVEQIPPSRGVRRSDGLMRYSKICVSILAILVSFGSAITEYMQEQLLSFVLAMIAIVLLAMNQILDLMTDLEKAPLPPTVDPESSLSDPGQTYASGEAEREANRSGGEGNSNGGESSNSGREENSSAVEGISSAVDNSSSGGDEQRLRTVTPAPSTSSNSENRSLTVPRPQRASTLQPPNRPSARASGKIVRHASWSPNAQTSLPPLAASTPSISENRSAIVPDRRRTSTSRWPGRASAGVDRRNSARNASWSQHAQTSDLPWLEYDISRAGLRQRIRTRSPESYAYAVEETGQESNRGGRRRTGSKRS